jgi:tripartite-type tricarboxylate transporter receptor subunit TctC
MKKCIALATIACAIGAISVAKADDWPTKPIKVVSPFAAGGSSDIAGRILSENLGHQFGHQVIVENRAGAGGLIGTTAVASSAPDGYTFVISSITTHVLGPLTATSAEYDPIRDFTHVAFIGGPPTVIVVHPSLQASTFKDMISKIRQNGETPYSSAGPRTLGNLIMEYLAEREGIKLSHVAYKGAGQAMADVTAGHVKVASFTSTAARGQIGSGQVLPLAVSSMRRMPELPNVPTLTELGYPELASTSWLGIAAPAKLPKPIVERMNKGVGAALGAVNVNKRLVDEGFETRAMQPEEIVEYIQSETAKWGPLARKLAAQ